MASLYIEYRIVRRGRSERVLTPQIYVTPGYYAATADSLNKLYAFVCITGVNDLVRQ